MPKVCKILRRFFLKNSQNIDQKVKLENLNVSMLAYTKKKKKLIER